MVLSSSSLAVRRRAAFIARCVVFVLAVVVGEARATAQPAASPQASPARAQSDARMLSASPDAPVASLGFRGTLRGAVGARLPLVGELAGTGFLLQLPALIELHNLSAQEPIPWQYWRGRLALEAIYRREAALGTRRAAFAGAFAVEHESDHSSDGHPGFVNLNSVSLRGDFTVALGLHALTTSLLTRLHLVTCTVDATTCGNYHGTGGSVTFEAATDVVFDGTLVAGYPYRYFVALHGAWLVDSGLAAMERRLVLDTGVALRPDGARGLFQLYLTALFGNDVGYYRGTREVAQAGFGFRWGL
jgi:hypothetical protein